MHQSSSTHLLGAWWQKGGRGGDCHCRQAATMPCHGGNKETGGDSNGGGRQQSIINNQLKVAVATAIETVRTAMTMNENKGDGGGRQRGVSSVSSMAGRAVAGSGGSLAVAAQCQWRQQCGSGRGSAAAVQQHCGSIVAAAWRRQLGGGGSVAAEAAVGDGRDEGGEVVMWRLFMFVIFLHISSVPVNRVEGFTKTHYVQTLHLN